MVLRRIIGNLAIERADDEEGSPYSPNLLIYEETSNSLKNLRNHLLESLPAVGRGVIKGQLNRYLKIIPCLLGVIGMCDCIADSETPSQRTTTCIIFHSSHAHLTVDFLTNR